MKKNVWPQVKKLRVKKKKNCFALINEDKDVKEN